MSVTRLKALQWGQESSWGTPVAATMKTPTLGDASAKINSVVWKGDFFGTVGPAEAQSLEAQDWNLTAPFAGAYELLPYPFESLWGIATPSGTGPYTYTYTAPYANVPSNVRSYTFEYGPIDNMYQLAGGLCNRIAINGEIGQPWQIESEFMGKQASYLASPASLAFLSVNLIRMADTVLYIDDWSGTIGSTQINATFIGFAAEFTSERHLKRFAGDVYPSAWGDSSFDGSLRLTLEFNTTSKAYLDAILSGLTSKLIRIKATNGSNEAQIDFAGVFDGEPELFSDRDGNVTLDLNLNARYNSTLGYWARVTATNSLASLP